VRIILSGALLLSASALLGCSSSSVLSFGATTTKSQYLTEKLAVEPGRPIVNSGASQNKDVETDSRETDDAKVYNVKVDDQASNGGTLPADDPRKALRELDRHQAEENRKIDAALAICHC
jgi:hypothetical protein